MGTRRFTAIQRAILLLLVMAITLSCSLFGRTAAPPAQPTSTPAQPTSAAAQRMEVGEPGRVRTPRPLRRV